MRAFNYSAIRDRKWDSEILGLIAAAGELKREGAGKSTHYIRLK